MTVSSVGAGAPLLSIRSAAPGAIRGFLGWMQRTGASISFACLAALLPGCFGDDVASPEPLRPVVLRSPPNVTGDFFGALAQRGFATLSLETPDGTPFAPPWDAVVDNPTDFAVTRVDDHTLRLESLTYTADHGLGGTLSIVTSDGRPHHEQRLSAYATRGSARIEVPGETFDARRLIAFTSGVESELRLILDDNFGGQLYDESLVVTAAGGTVQMPTRDGLLVTAVAGTPVRIQAHSNASAPLDVEAAVDPAITEVVADVQHLVVNRAGTVCAQAIAAGGRQVLGLTWSWTVAQGAATVSPSPELRGCARVLSGVTGELRLTAAVPGASGTVTVMVSAPARAAPGGDEPRCRRALAPC